MCLGRLTVDHHGLTPQKGIGDTAPGRGGDHLDGADVVVRGLAVNGSKRLRRCVRERAREKHGDRSMFSSVRASSSLTTAGAMQAK